MTDLIDLRVLLGFRMSTIVTDAIFVTRPVTV